VHGDRGRGTLDRRGQAQSLGGVFVLAAPACTSEGRRVTVSVAAEDTDRIRLMYDPSTWGHRNLYPIEAGETATVFGPCLPHRSTQFNGGFLVSGRVCATIEVEVGDTEPQRSVVSFGARCSRD
jgi:hypothetical protein